MAGKGDARRPRSVSREVYERNYERWQQNSINKSRGESLPPGFRYAGQFRSVHKGEYYKSDGGVYEWEHNTPSEQFYAIVKKDQKKKNKARQNCLDYFHEL